MTNVRKMPIGIQDFQKLREDGFVYVDKTALLYQSGCLTIKGYDNEFDSLTLGYAAPYSADSRTLVRGGAVFSSEQKNIIEWKVVS